MLVVLAVRSQKNGAIVDISNPFLTFIHVDYSTLTSIHHQWRQNKTFFPSLFPLLSFRPIYYPTPS
jgi:hypothetical protein